MRIQYFSDIHLEFGDCDFPVTDADIVIAAGDIGVDTQAVDWLAQAPCPVIYIAGNHEYYGGDLEHTYQRLEQECARAQIELLENIRADLDDVRFLGTTLWTDFGGSNKNIMHESEQCMNDYHYIRNAGEPLTANDLLRIHQGSLEWLEAELSESFRGKTVVVTHHAPSLKSWYAADEIARDLRRFAYCNQLDEMIRRYSIDLWFHGHIHSVSDYRIGDTRILSNPRGYHGHQIVEGFDPHKTVDL